ncbi:MAG: chemotaxis protein CheR [Desulfuromonadales bacterium]|nr:chemotaxis protein CheR [Desulfuromonadales bacterium]NIR34046.1 chemotaxis protein CheR [Desulfuromonadales bacterium]NIS44097.1 chemotaxis protein CheR [Desulfuromonadales bacterium]
MKKESYLRSLEVMSDQDFRKFSQFIHTHLGIKMPPQKKSMLEARLRKRLRALGLKTFREYRDMFFSDEGMALELGNLCNAVTTNKTDFFREPAHFDFLTDTGLAELLQRFFPDEAPELRIWSAGCSTGEEPYSLAMVLANWFVTAGEEAFSILGTDLSTRVLDTAHTAIYDMDRILPVPQNLRRKYLLKSKDRERRQVRIVPEIRSRVRFRQLNFMDPEYDLPHPFHAVFCRNVIIYFDRPTQSAIVSRICRHLLPGGFLFMGHSETLSGLNLPLQQVAPSVYRKLGR